MEIFDALPEIDTPEILGLPDNCRVAWEKNAADSIIAGLRGKIIYNLSKMLKAL